MIALHLAHLNNLFTHDGIICLLGVVDAVVDSVVVEGEVEDDNSVVTGVVLSLVDGCVVLSAEF